MLDQNTDRMWFVIGAVIVGAAIIFIANGTLPTLFASVSDSFEESADKGTEVISEIDPMKGMNLLNQFSGVEMAGGSGISLSGQVVNFNNNQHEYLRFADIAPIIDRYGPEQTYRLEFELKSKDISQYNKVRIYMQNGNITKYHFAGGANRVLPVTTEYQTYILEGLSFRRSGHDTDVAHLAFFGGLTNEDYGNGNIPVVKNVKLFLE